jgi:hypothetical protein
MDIHKPKPVHSIREFLNEIVVIITGVLIALGLEQAVESWHHAEQVADARETLREELAVNLAALRHTQRNTPCLIANADRMVALIDSVDPAKIRAFARQANDPAHTAPGGRMSTGMLSLRLRAWETANSSGLLAYMAPREKLAFAAAYSRVDLEKRYRVLFSDLSPEISARAEVFDGSHEEAQALKRLIIEQRGFYANRLKSPFKEIADVVGDYKLKDDPTKALSSCEPIEV